MGPYIGLIVLYREGDGIDRPAIVTHVWSANCVNLAVMRDGSYDKEPGVYQVTSAMKQDQTSFARWRGLADIPAENQ